MGEANKALGVKDDLRDARDAVMKALAKVTLRVTSSHKYQRVQYFISTPVLLAMALIRKTSAPAMSGLLAQLNMPSREDVLTLAQRMTHVEMVLDDVDAGLEQVLRSMPTPRTLWTPSRDRDIAIEPSRAVMAEEA
jgi:hypothetical protein